MNRPCQRARAGRRRARLPRLKRIRHLVPVAAAGAAALLTTAPASAPAVSAPRLAKTRGGPSLAGFERLLGLVDLARPAELRVRERQRARARAASAADRVTRMIDAMVHAGDRIAHLPYVYGGGHGSFDAAGYDCSGSVSYVLHAAGLLDTPMDSSGLMGYGAPGPGRRVTVYSNPGHALIVIDGRRFDTIAFQETGTRWADSVGSTDGYVVRHPAGL